jgi:hypothetical protein
MPHPIIDHLVGYANRKEPRYIHYDTNLVLINFVPMFLCDVLALHDAGVHLLLNAKAMHRMTRTRKAANDHLTPFTKIPASRVYSTPR